MEDTFTKEAMGRMLDLGISDLLLGDHTYPADTETSASTLTPEILEEMKRLAGEPVLTSGEIISGTLPEYSSKLLDASQYVMPQRQDFVWVDDNTAETTPERVGEARKKFYEEQDDAGAF
jgi:hypothetical protein